ncbi:MAG TPA: tyrosine-type recombinase/integrase [Prosthecobacter sp.]
MASVFRRVGTKYFHADFTDANGVRHHRSTKTTNRKEAEKIAYQYEEAARKKRTMAQFKQVISDFHEQISGEKVKTVSLSGFIEAWLKEKEPETKPATMESYRFAVKRFADFVSTRDNGDIYNVGRGLIVQYRGELLETVTPSTTNQHLKCIKMLFRAAKRSGMIAEDPAESVDFVRKGDESVERKPLKVEDIKKVLALADDEWKSIILVGLYTGQRLSDVAKLDWSSVNLETETISLVATKTGRHMTLPVAAPLKANFLKTPKEKRHGPVHPKAATPFKKGGKSNNLSKHFGRLLEAAGIREKASPAKKKPGGSAKRKINELTFHSFRHTAMSLLKEAGVDQATAMEIIGHESAQMSAHYTHVSEESLKKAAAKLPDIVSI